MATLNLADRIVDQHVRDGRGARPAIRAGDDAWTYEDLRRLTNRAGNALAALGVRRGDRVLLRLGTTIDMALGFLGAVKIGAVPIPTSPLLREHELRTILANSEAVVALTTPELVGPLEAARAAGPALRHVVLAGPAAEGPASFGRLLARASDVLGPAATSGDDPAFLMYTSGTTGHPKGVLHGHRWILGTGLPITGTMMRLTPADVCFQPQDWSFIYALGCNLLYPLLAGASVIVPAGRFDPQETAACIARHGVTVFCAVPTIYRMMLASSDDGARASLASLRIGVSAGEPLPADTFREWQERFGVTIYDGIGQTECHIFLANRVGSPVRPGSMGTPLPTYDVAVLDDEGRRQAVGEPGHLVIRNDHPGLTLGYFRDPERWAQVNRGGWYDTSDYAYVDGDGAYWYVSRADDLIKSRGYLVSPKEVESALMEHPAVLEAGVVGVPDPVVGQRVCAYVTLRPGVASREGLAEELRAHTRRVIAPYKTPHEIEFVTELPKTLTGKVLRRALRTRA